MKKGKFTLVALAALFLAGCGKVNTTTTVPSKDTATQQQTTAKPTTDKPTTSKATEPATTSAAPTTVSVDPEDADAKKWGTKVANVMKAHLNGHVVPYVKFCSSTSNLDPSYNANKGRVEVIGDIYTEGDTKIADAKTAYDARGWDTTGSTSTSMKATLATENLTVTLSEGTGDSDGMYLFTATWEEPYDPTAASDWPTDVKDGFTTYIHGHEIPYVYLATVAPVASGPSSSYASETMNIIGGKWDADIITKAKANFAADNSVTWDTTGSTTTTFKGVATMADKCTLTVEISSNYNSKAQMKITMKEGFNPPTGADWTQDVKDAFVTSLGSHSLPYVYLGTLNPDIDTATVGKLVLTGGTWDDQILDLAETAFSSDNADGVNWTITKTSTKVTAIKDFANGDKLSVTIEDYEDPYYYYYGTDPEYPQLTALFTQGYTVPTDPNERMWSTDIQDQMKAYLGGTVLPWFYVNLAKDDVGYYYYSYSKELDIKGGDWDDKVVTEFTNALNADSADTANNNGRNWTITTDDTTSSNYTYYIAETDDSSSSHFKLKLYKNYSNKILLEIYFTEGFIVPDAASSVWPQGVQDDMTANLGSLFPYVYLGASNPTSYWSSYSKTLTVTGGLWNDQVIDLAKTAFSNAGWDEVNETTNSYGKCVVAEKHNAADNGFDRVTVGKSSSSSSANATYIAAHYDAVTIPEGGSWDSTVEADMKKYLGNKVFPYLYMNSSSCSTYYSTYSNYLSVTGGEWHLQFADAAVTALEALNNADTDTTNDWVITVTDNGSNGNKVTATKVDTDGSKLKLEYYGNSSTYMYCYYWAPFVAPTDPAEQQWNSTITAGFTSNLGGHAIPWFYMGAAKDDVTAYVSSYDTYLNITGGTWDDSIFTLARTALDNDGGWTYVQDYSTSNEGGDLVASKAFTEADGTVKHLTLRLYKNYSSKPYMTVYYK